MRKSSKSAQQNAAASKLLERDKANASPPAAASNEATLEDVPEHVPNADILSALRSMQSDFSKKFDDVMSGICGIKADLQSQSIRITEAEERIGRAEDNLESMHSVMKTLQEKCARLETKVEDQENRARRNNLRLIGLPEKAEGRDMCAFLEGWLPKALGADTFPTPPVVERAHRIGRPSAGRDPKPRTVIMKFLNCRDKENAMRAARAKKSVLFENHSIRIYPDHSAETHRQQRLFDPVKRQLQSMGLRYGLLYPATMVVTYNGQQHFFKTVLDAEAFVKKIQQDPESSPEPRDV